ncbi:hypothetical protein [Amycolatopsis orientalis]|uniref:hypothetical protein n=1 Tax=Amycolatopsis orientalis TaxID=31958 RepID=UPI0034DCD677
MNALYDFLTQRIGALRGVVQVETAPVARRAKRDGPLLAPRQWWARRGRVPGYAGTARPRAAPEAATTAPAAQNRRPRRCPGRRSARARSGTPPERRSGGSLATRAC